MNESFYIYKIIRWLEMSGVVVHPYAFELQWAGMYRSETREIFINVPVARQALLTLAHEAGHWLGYCFSERKHSYQRERQAFVYGWKVLCLVGANKIVSRQQWIDDNRILVNNRNDG